MLLLHAEELGLLGIAFQATSQLVYQNTRFTKGPSFPTDERQAAITSCNKYLRADIVCLIIENDGYLTLWPEKKDINLPAQQPAISSSEPSKYQNTFTDPQSSQKTEKSKPSSVEPSLRRLVAKNNKFAAAS
ncbi:hypothetical protein [Microcoleus sp. FACHB-68]|uniref:hypothetical protein n=1 Tax=Microcoleus sp. FACHB-68 TaxID=2692826 RepID=UPI0016881CED|nr:hypothetical protein [Microcoleus sp. FACHB-68]MBD1937288.1 hypothetical protein [Microcoleus sp. FACHB-68]